MDWHPDRHMRVGMGVRQFVLALALAMPAAAQTAEKIIAQHIAALGGAKLLKASAAVEYRGEAGDAAAGERGSFTLAGADPLVGLVDWWRTPDS